MPAGDADAIEELADEIATLSAHISAATHRLLVLIAEFDRLRGWELAGYSNCARWLAARTGIDVGAAREKVRAARALAELPQTSAAMSRGELSFSQVRALSRVARAETEGELLELARGTTTAQLERMVRAWKRGSRLDEADWERERHASRTFSVFPDDNGMYVVRGLLPPEIGALLMRALDAASDTLFRDPSPSAALPDSETEAAQRRADAVGQLAERALTAGFGSCGCEARVRAVDSTNGEPARSSGRETPHVVDTRAWARERPADAPSGYRRAPHSGNGAPPAQCDCSASAIPLSGTRAERYLVVLHVDPQTLGADGETGRSELEDGTRVSGETARRLSCDASVVRVRQARDGSILELGRKTRTISPALRRALELRDRGCRFPGCHLRNTDGHHMRHWASGGETGLSNCLLLCGFHHRLVHEGGWRVEWWGPARPVYIDRRGGTHFDGRWQPPKLGDRPADALVRENRARGVDPDAWTTAARWERESDIPDSVYFRALEAL